MDLCAGLTVKNDILATRMEEEATQLYRRPQMTGQAREEEEEEDTSYQFAEYIQDT